MIIIFPGTAKLYDCNLLTIFFSILLQLRYPLCLVLLSNNRGLFEVLNSCRPYVLFVICDVLTETTLKVLTLDCAWMLRMSDMVSSPEIDNFRHTLHPHPQVTVFF
jgi:hypothetical protein